MSNVEEKIRERAYHLWIADGQPQGQPDIYWLNAQREILTTSLESSNTGHMDLASATPKPVKKVNVTRSEKAKPALHISTRATG